LNGRAETGLLLTGRLVAGMTDLQRKQALPFNTE
jgi:hypothetical protein